jgi:hypothetical protein
MNFNLNPLDVLGKRKLSFMPLHFVKVKISDLDFLHDEVTDWVESKLQGRFSISYEPSVDDNGKLKSSTFVGFEDQKELTYFLLACPYSRRN